MNGDHDTTRDFTICLDDIVIDCEDAAQLAAFYAGLLGWTATPLEGDCFIVESPGHTDRYICQHEEDYVPPVWPEKEGAQQKSIHLDFTVSDLQKAVAYAVSLGAVVAAEQYKPEKWITLFDPAGHPICLCLPDE